MNMGYIKVKGDYLFYFVRCEHRNASHLQQKKHAQIFNQDGHLILKYFQPGIEIYTFFQHLELQEFKKYIVVKNAHFYVKCLKKSSFICVNKLKIGNYYAKV